MPKKLTRKKTTVIKNPILKGLYFILPKTLLEYIAFAVIIIFIVYQFDLLYSSPERKLTQNIITNLAQMQKTLDNL